MYGKRHCPETQRQAEPQSADLEVAQEAIASLRRRVKELENKGQFFARHFVPGKIFHL